MQRELMGSVPRLPPLHAAQIVNRAWQRVRDCRLWSFSFITDGQLFVPAVISAGSVNCTYQSPTIIADTAATAAINAVGLTVPSIGSPTIGLGRQLKVGSSSSGLNPPSGPNYNIVAWDDAGNLTLDRPFGESTQTLAKYQILKCFFSPPAWPFGTIPGYDPTFIRYVSLRNVNSGYTIRGRKLWYTQAMLNAIDPQRGGQGEAYIVANYGSNNLGQPISELYPNPVTQATYTATYFARWPSLSATVSLPVMPYALETCVMDLARQFAAQWAGGNIATFPELGRTNWVAMQNSYKQDFKEGLIQCIKVDDTIMPAVAFQQGSLFDFPLGGQFLQAHDVSSLIA